MGGAVTREQSRRGAPWYGAGDPSSRVAGTADSSARI